MTPTILFFLISTLTQVSGSLVSSIAPFLSPKREVVVAFTNRGYVPFAVNWARSVKRYTPHHVVLATDRLALSELVAAGVNAVLVQEGPASLLLPVEAASFDSPEFYTVVNVKPKVVLLLLRAGVTVFLNDVDVVWLADAWGAARSQAGDAVVQTDAPFGAGYGGFTAFVNTGFMLLRASRPTIALMEAVVATVEAQPGAGDQNAFNSVIAHGHLGAQLNLHILDPLAFPNGFVWAYRRSEQALGAKPVIVHCNWISGSRAKVLRLKEAGLWEVGPPSAASARYLTYEQGPALWKPEVGQAADLDDLRGALGIARALNRTLILPRVSCGPGHGEARDCDVTFLVDVNGLLERFDTVESRFLLTATSVANLAGLPPGDGPLFARDYHKVASTKRILHVGRPSRFAGFQDEAADRQFEDDIRASTAVPVTIARMGESMAQGMGPFLCVLIGGPRAKSIRPATKTAIRRHARLHNLTRVHVIIDPDHPGLPELQDVVPGPVSTTASSFTEETFVRLAKEGGVSLFPSQIEVTLCSSANAVAFLAERDCPLSRLICKKRQGRSCDTIPPKAPSKRKNEL
jgi:hypothetical protein